MTKLPVWNLTDLFSGMDDPKIEQEFKDLDLAVNAFINKAEGRMIELDDDAFGAMISEYERICERMAKISAFAYLLYSEDVTDKEVQRFSQNVRERITTFSTKILFFTLAINKLDDNVMAEKLKFPAASRYAPWLKHIRTFRQYQLNDREEQLLNDKAQVNANWIRLYDELLGKMVIGEGKEQTDLTMALEKLSSPNEEERKKYAVRIAKALEKDADMITMIYNTIIKDKEIDDKWRGYKTPMSEMNLHNKVEDEIVDTLTLAVKTNYKNISHRYYAMKAKMMGKDRLEFWDRNAPIDFTGTAKDKEYSFEQAKEIILGAFSDFAPEMGDIAAMFFDKNWINAELKKGKMGGAYAHPVTPSTHPYILTNFNGKARDVMTLAHELGHGVHQWLASRNGYLMSDTPLNFAETASVFAEMLTFDRLLKNENDPLKQKSMLCEKIEDKINTVIRQIAFHEFETEAHYKRRISELSKEDLTSIWLKVQKESLGDAFKDDKHYDYYWTYISHFFHSPFYVYAYAFADCIVNSLYKIYSESEGEEKQKFVDNYLDMLRAGGTKSHEEMLSPFGLSAANIDFWNKGLAFINDLIVKMEKL